MFDQADSILGIPLSRICFDGPEELLRQTENTQPARYLHSVILTRLMKSRDAVMAAGSFAWRVQRSRVRRNSHILSKPGAR